MSTTQLVTIAVLVVLAFWMLGAYNRLVKHRNEIGNAFAQIDVQLKRRYDLIPNLVEVARKYVQHERETLEAVIAARNGARSASEGAAAKPADAARINLLSSAEGALASLMSRFSAVIEAYPALKADASLRELAEELNHTENRIAFARQAFNDAVLDYNNAAQQAPTNLIAAVFGFQAASQLQSTASEAERAAPRVAL